MIDEPSFDSAPAEEDMEGDGMGGGDESQMGQGMAVINREVCPNCQPGDMLTFKVERVHNDEIELSLHEGGEDEEMPEKPSEAEPAMSGSDY